MFYKKAAHRNFSIFTGQHLYWSLFLIMTYLDEHLQTAALRLFLLELSRVESISHSILDLDFLIEIEISSFLVFSSNSYL